LSLLLPARSSRKKTAIVFVCLADFVAYNDSTVGKKASLFFYALTVIMLLLRFRHRHGFFFDFFKLYLSVAMSGAFQWHQLS
jgi:uncharacterized membrane protein